MNLKLPVTVADVDALVKAYLDDEARRVDLPRVEAALAVCLRDTLGEPATERPGVALRAPGWSAPGRRMAVAACLCLAVAGVLYFALAPERAGAYALVQAAHRKLSSGTDRCYRLDGKLPDGWVKGNPFLRLSRDTRVWTRGDRFRVSINEGEHPIAWGQDKDRNFWLVYGSVGFQFIPGEEPGFLRPAKFLLAMNLGPLVRRFLDDFDLTRGASRTEDGHRVFLVHATLKPGHSMSWFDAAYLEIEPKTKLIRRLEIQRSRPSRRPLALDFTLLEEAGLTDDDYRIESCLPAGGEVFGPDRAAERDRRFRALLAARRPSAAQVHPADKLPADSQ